MNEPPADNNPPHTVMERIAVLESKVDLLVRALQLAFGERWMDELKVKHESAKQ